MLFKGLLATDLSGSIDGITASRNRGGAYFRNRVTPVNPNSSQQQAVRGYFATLATAWRDELSAAERAAWTTYAENSPITNAIGESIVLTGLAMYQRTNVPVLQAGLTRIDAAPTVFGFPSFTDPSVSAVDATADEVDIAFTNTDAWAVTTGGAMLVYASRPQNASINFFKGPYRYAGAILGDTTTPPTSPSSIALPFPVVAGQQVFFKVNVLNPDGRYSGPFRLAGVAA